MKNFSFIIVVIMLIIFLPTHAQVFSTPGAVVSDNGTVDQVLINGFTKLINSTGRTLMIERDDDDSWLSFHDPGQYVYSMGIDRSNNGSFTINSGSLLGQSNHFVMNSGGKIGIGTPTPAYRLSIRGLESDQPSLLVSNSSYSSTNSTGTSSLQFGFADHVGPKIEAFKITSNTTGIKLYTEYGFNTPVVGMRLTPVASSEALVDVSGSLVLRNMNNVSYGGASIHFTSYDGAVNPGPKIKSELYYTQGESSKSSLVLSSYWEGYKNEMVLKNGMVGIGTTDTYGYKLAIAGNAIAEEIVVKLKSEWPDYVFEDSYHLPLLTELEQFIKKNKHLPDVPTSDQVDENGLSLGEMNAILLKKVEELTLHLININKRIETLEVENNNQKNEIESLKKIEHDN